MVAVVVAVAVQVVDGHQRRNDFASVKQWVVEDLLEAGEAVIVVVSASVVVGVAMRTNWLREAWVNVGVGYLTYSHSLHVACSCSVHGV